MQTLLKTDQQTTLKNLDEALINLDASFTYYSRKLNVSENQSSWTDRLNLFSIFFKKAEFCWRSRREAGVFQPFKKSIEK